MDPKNKDLQEFENQLEEQKELLNQLLIAKETFSGPLPPPKYLQGYEDCLIGSADRILSMAEAEQKAQINLDNKLIENEFKLRNRGMIFAFFVFIISITIGGSLIYIGKDGTGLAVIITAVAPALGRFILDYWKYNKSKKDRSDPE